MTDDQRAGRGDDVKLTRDEVTLILRELAELIAGLERIENRLRHALMNGSDGK